MSTQVLQARQAFSYWNFCSLCNLCQPRYMPCSQQALPACTILICPLPCWVTAPRLCHLHQLLLPQSHSSHHACQEGLAVRQRKKKGCFAPWLFEVMRWGVGVGLATCPLSSSLPSKPPPACLALAKVDWGLLIHTEESLQALVTGYIIKPSWQMRK